MNLTSSEANQRMTANEAAQHPWFNLKINNNRKTKSRSKRVYLALKEAVVKEQDI